MNWVNNNIHRILFGFFFATIVLALSASYYNFYVLDNYKQFTLQEAGYTEADDVYSCEWGNSTFLIFSENVGNLIYYTHIFPLVISLFIGIFVFFNNTKDFKNRILFVMTVLFAVWAYLDLILWASPSQSDVMFFWSAIVPVEMLLYATTLLLVYLFTRPKKPKRSYYYIASFFILPTILLMHTPLNVIGLSPDCDEGAFEGPVIHYMYLMEILVILIIAYLTFTSFKFFSDKNDRRKALVIGSATIVFLSFFTAGNLTLMFELGPNYEQYKLFGMPIFAAIVTYSFLKLKTFGVKVFSAQILVAVIWMLLFSTILLESMDTARWLILGTLIVFGILGIRLVNSVKNEIQQREELEKITKKLAHANDRLQELDKLKSEFVSIASHQMRSPLTSIRGYASMLIEQSFGEIPEKAMDPLKRIEESARHMAMAIEDYLNVSRIESGNMKYNNSDFNLKDEAEKICDDIRPIAMEKQLVLLFRSNLNSRAIVNADIGKTIQIIHNLINNSIKYTPKGSITVYMRDDLVKKRIYIDITDTGIGINQENLEKLFQKFSRANNANSVNVTGTGLGLFVARQMAVAMGGDITAKSEGDGKGSTFTFELPLMM